MLLLKSWLNCVPLVASHARRFTLLSFLIAKEEQNKAGNDPMVKPKLYWRNKSIGEIISEADELFNRGRFLEVYELLNRQKFGNNVNIQWRISRALYKLSTDASISDELRKEMISEAYELMKNTLELEENNSNIYKWMAIILDAKNGTEGLAARIKSFETVKRYLLKAVELNPEDAVTNYILGKWCFEMSKISSLQRLVASIFYGSIPSSDFSEAYGYLLKCYEMRPDAYYIPNVYLLGESCYHMNQFYKARFYLNAAATFPPRTDYEREYSAKARTLLKRLDIYDLSKETVLFEFPF